MSGLPTHIETLLKNSQEGFSYILFLKIEIAHVEKTLEMPLSKVLIQICNFVIILYSLKKKRNFIIIYFFFNLLCTNLKLIKHTKV